MRVVVPLRKGEIIRAYKQVRLRLTGVQEQVLMRGPQAKRRDDDIAIVTSCFAMKVHEGVIEHAKLAYGGMA